MGRAVTNAGRQAYLAISDARIAKLNDELLTKLIDAATTVLRHHNPTGEVEVVALRKRFARILKIKL